MSHDELARLAAYVRATVAQGRTVERVGPFLATFTADDANPYLNYAIPDDGASPIDDEVAMLVTAFERRNRVARCEYFSALCPALGEALSKVDFTTEAVLALLAAGSHDLHTDGLSADFTIRPPATADELVATARVQRAAFAETQPADGDVAAGLKRIVASGGFVAAAIEPRTGRVVGAGTCSGIRGGFGEIAGVAVDAAFRGRKLASILTASLAASAFAAGAELVFFTPGGDAATRSYARVGFHRIGDQVHTSRRRPPAPPGTAAGTGP